MKLIGYFTVVIIMAAYSAVLNGWALTKIWSWFIVTTFGLPTLSIPAAIGLAGLVGYMTHQLDFKKADKSAGNILESFLTATFKPLFFLLFGWVVTLFM